MHVLNFPTNNLYVKYGKNKMCPFYEKNTEYN